MKRRSFLKQTGLAVIGGTAARATAKADAASGPVSADPRQAGRSTTAVKKVLVTSAQGRLARAIAAGLADSHTVHLTATSDVRTELPFTRCDLGHDAATAALVCGMDAIVHVAEPPPGATDAQRIDLRTRATYNLLHAAGQEEVRRMVFLSSLAMMTGYDPDFQVSEDWRPLATGESSGLSDFLGESVCREFARQAGIDLVVLRLGRVVWAHEVAGKTSDPLWVDHRDVVQAIRLAIRYLTPASQPGPGRWSVFHIQAGLPNARFSIAKAKALLGYQPQFNGNP